MAAAIQPTIGMLLMATDTARQAVVAAVEKTPKDVEAMVEKVAEAVPPVTKDNTNAPNPLRALKRPTVAKRKTARVACRILALNVPLTTAPAAKVWLYIIRPATAEMVRMRTVDHMVAHCKFLMPNIVLFNKDNKGESWAMGTNASVRIPHHNAKSPVSWNIDIFKSSKFCRTRACRSA